MRAHAHMRAHAPVPVVRMAGEDSHVRPPMRSTCASAHTCAKPHRRGRTADTSEHSAHMRAQRPHASTAHTCEHSARLRAQRTLARRTHASIAHTCEHTSAGTHAPAHERAQAQGTRKIALVIIAGHNRCPTPWDVLIMLSAGHNVLAWPNTHDPRLTALRAYAACSPPKHCRATGQQSLMTTAYEHTSECASRYAMAQPRTDTASKPRS